MSYGSYYYYYFYDLMYEGDEYQRCNVFYRIKVTTFVRLLQESTRADRSILSIR